jgi:hypothetical protein
VTDSLFHSLKQFIKRIPAIGPALAYARVQSRIKKPTPTKVRPGFHGSTPYWEERYRTGGDSGTGSGGRLAEFKAEIINEFVAKEGIESLIEFGCGDGRQLLLARYPKYLGVDVSGTIVERCRLLFSDRPEFTFFTTDQYRGETADLTLSLDVIFHLIEDEVFSSYMSTLFDAATRCVIIYSSNFDSESAPSAPHFRNREFTLWIAAHRPEWQLIRHIPNRYPFNGDGQETSVSDFFIFRRSPTTA